MNAYWYFDFVSPFSYLQWPRIRTLSGQVAFEYRPVLFAAILDHLDHRGPAEIDGKRVFTYRHALWRAARLGVPMKFPPTHPFNPIAALRLCIAAGCTADAITAIFDHLWRDGRGGDDPVALAPVAAALGIDDVGKAVSAAPVKERLRANYEAALAAGVFGVPTIVAGNQVFWGEDATGMFEDFIADPGLFDQGEMRRVTDLPVGATRRR